jgi:hypothetical protein
LIESSDITLNDNKDNNNFKPKQLSSIDSGNSCSMVKSTLSTKESDVDNITITSKEKNIKANNEKEGSHIKNRFKLKESWKLFKEFIFTNILPLKKINFIFYLVYHNKILHNIRFQHFVQICLF